MNQPQKYFEDNGYVVLSDVISQQQAADLTQHMFNLHKEGKLIKDEQCPLSDAIYGDPVFDNLLVSLADSLGQHVGRKLLPTYSYARIYRPGDVLKRHIDRPACEISATLTLGYDAKVPWPIFFKSKDGVEVPVDLKVGELAMYKGTELMHWRQPFKGNWHVQVFIHYVDADGPYASEAMDGRAQFGVDKSQQTSSTNQDISQKLVVQQIENELNKEIKIVPPVHNCTYIPNLKDNFIPGYFPINENNLPELMFTNDECDKIIKIIEDLYPSSASVGGDANVPGKISKKIRSANVYSVENNNENKWIFDKIAKSISIANTLYYDYDVSSINHGLQLIHYPSNTDVKGHYDWHIDAGNGVMATRKISFTAQLSHPDSYEGCDLIVNDHGVNVKAERQRGSISLFPSYMPHVVTPIEKGDRYALVIWAHGSKRFR